YVTAADIPTSTTDVDIDALCRAHLPLVAYEVRAISARLPGHVYTDDLTSAGMAALTMAARSFDATLGVPFGRYAVRRIRGALLDELRSADWATRSLRAKVRKRDTTHDSLAAELGRRPTGTETAAALGIPVADLERLEADLHASVVLRLDVITDTTGADALLPASTTTPETTLIARERTAYLHDAITTLPQRLQTVIRGCFFDERPMRELADQLGVTESRISQMRAEALTLLKDGLNANLDPDLLPTPATTTGAVARRKASYYAAIATKSTYHDRLTLTPATATA
ncbi:MAG TPA: sigma-70 family RNA polymerase sigma factor, partial [Dermatophilaceae bacterium]|nr:sigma-70 family RNA polymerase sigma factor [Dermatophilaceae bacterium]